MYGHVVIKLKSGIDIFVEKEKKKHYRYYLSVKCIQKNVTGFYCEYIFIDD